ncbi:MAG: MATE family efflux transporter [Phycisphaeraceae bacterium]
MNDHDAIDELTLPGHPLPSGRRVPIELLMLAAPIIAAMISRTVMSFVDFVMVSQLGTEAQAAIMPAGILLFCVISFGMGTLSVINTFVSQSLGRGRLADCSAYAWQGLYLSLAIGLILLPAWFVMPALFAWVGHAPEVQRMEVAYVQIGLLSLAPTLAALALTDFFNGLHRPAVGFWTALISNIFNAVANYALIFGHFGFPALGIAGAAWGTTAAVVLHTLLLLAWMLRPSLHARYQSRHTWRPSAARLRRILWFGLPAGAQFTIDVVAFTIFTLLLVGRFGTAQLAAHNLVFKFLEISFMPTVGLGTAVTAAVGKALGQKRPDLARVIVRWATLFAVAYMGAIGLGYVVFNHSLPGLLSDDPEVIRWAGRLLYLCALFQIFDGLNIVYVHALRGAGDNHWPAAVGALGAGGILVGGGYLTVALWPGMEALGPWAAATVYIIALGLTMWARFASGAWQRIDLLGPEAQTPEPVAVETDAERSETPD